MALCRDLLFPGNFCVNRLNRCLRIVEKKNMSLAIVLELQTVQKKMMKSPIQLT